MKKLTVWLLMMAACVCISVSAMAANGSCGNSVKWTLDEATGTLTLTGTGPTFSYSDASAYGWYSSRKSITSIVVGEGITQLGAHTFFECAATSVELPSTLTMISTGAFESCANLPRISLPAGLATIGEKAFFNCEKLWNVYYTGSVETRASSITIGYNNTQLTNATWHYTQTSGFCGYNATYTLDTITGILHISGTGRMTDHASGQPFWYDDRTSITRLIVDEGITHLGTKAFSGCTALKEVELPETLESIGINTFASCTSLTGITLPVSVTRIEGYAFDRCTKLADVFYGGSRTDREGMTISSPNTYLLNAAWHYAANEIGGPCGDNVTWRLNQDTGVLTISGTGPMTSYTNSDPAPWGTDITEVVISEGVTSIGSNAFDDCSSMTSITLPSTLTNIPSFAFRNCSSLASITIPSGVKYILQQTFSGCSALKSVTIPSSVTSISNEAFFDCSSLASIEIPDNVTYLGNGAFSGCSALSSITIPSSVKAIQPHVFSQCKSLTSIEIPRSVTSIGSNAFELCSNLTDIRIPNSVTSIGSGAFRYCTSLTGIALPDHITSIESSTFKNCIKLSSISFPSSVTSIGSDAFAYCYKLTDMIIPDGVAGIADGTFSYCSNLGSIMIPTSVTSIGSSAFTNCAKLTDVYYAGSVIDHSAITISSGNDPLLNVAWHHATPESGKCGDNVKWTLDSDTGLLTISGKGKMTDFINPSLVPWGQDITEVVIQDGVTSIGSYAFEDCTKLTCISIPNSVTSLGRYTFHNCSELTSISIPNGVTALNEEIFCNCFGLKSITLPEGLTHIGEYAFENCYALTDIDLPGSVYSIGKYAFSSCINLTSIILPARINRIYPFTFSWCSGLTSITIPNTVTAIDDHAFNSCYSLSSVSLPLCTTIIGDSAFLGCNRLVSVSYAGSPMDREQITIAGGNDYLLDVEWTYAINEISGSCGEQVTWVLNRDTGLLTISGEGGMADYSGSAPAPWGTEITTVVISDGVTGIGAYAFLDCSKLAGLTIPGSVGQIGSGAINGCTTLTAEPEHITLYCSEHLDAVLNGLGLTGPDAVTVMHTGDLVAADDEDAVFPATCTEDGYQFLVCSTCHHDADKLVLPATGHTPAISIGLAADCTHPGLTDGSYCAACGEVLAEQQVIMPTGHVSVTDDAAAPTCTESGLTEGAHCEVCGMILAQQQPINALGHRPSASQHNSIQCARCSEPLPGYVLPAKLSVIDDEAFMGTDVQYVIIPDGVTSIGSKAFADCRSLTAIEIPASVQFIADDAFDGCGSIVLYGDSVNEYTTLYALDHDMVIPVR